MNILTLELRNLKRSAVISTAVIATVIFAMLAFFPSMQNESMQALTNAKLEGVDPSLLAALGLTNMLDFTVITNFFGYVLQFIVLAVMVIITQQAANLFLKEESDGTIEFLYAKPVSRSAIFVQKLLAHVLLFIAMLIVWAAVTVIGYLLFSDYSFGSAMRESAIFYGSFLFVGLMFSMAGLLLSTLLSGSARTSGITIGIVFGTYILGVVSVIVDKLSFFVWLSPMDWIKTQKLMSEGILLQEWIVGISVIMIAALAAWLLYNRKDLLI